MKLKILIGIGILFLLIGAVAAFEINSLKTLDGYTNFENGQSNYTTNSNRYFFVEKVVFDDTFKHDYFESDGLGYVVTPKENNAFYYEDNDLTYGYQEIVEIDGNTYMVSINQNSKLSPSEETGFLSDLKEFNKLNSLEPIAV